MIKKMFLLLCAFMMMAGIAYADVIDFHMGHYNFFGLEIPSDNVWQFTALFLIIIIGVLALIICKKLKSKTAKVITALISILICVFISLALPDILPSPSFNHGRITRPVLKISAFNSRIEQFFGSNKSASVVRDLVIGVNAINAEEDDKRIKFEEIDGIITYNGNIPNFNHELNRRYDISAKEYDYMGYIETIEVKEHVDEFNKSGDTLVSN